MFLVREDQENFKLALWGASTLQSQSKRLFSEPPQKLVAEAAIVDLRSFDLNSNLTRQTPVKIVYKPGLDYLL